MVRWSGHVARMTDGRNAFTILTDKPTRKRLLGRPRHRWKDNVIMDIRNWCQCKELS